MTEPFQARVRPWLMACFGEEISADHIERNHRFLEEALELVQSRQCSRSEAHQLVDYVFDRPIGEPKQEVGGTMVTLAALCLAAGIDMHEAGDVELERIWGKVEAIRAKQAAKPRHSPLPQEAAPISAGTMFLDRTGREICMGDTIEVASTINQHTHGDWVQYDIRKGPGGFLLSYRCSQTGAVLPPGYTAGFMAESLPEDDRRDLKALVFATVPVPVSGWEIVGGDRRGTTWPEERGE
ncbi:hypothetical protein [Sphingomonas leidyi]|uniref:hypothetical protein n=1 Tax=Sphingomonas leidyi TaxID=68569 RepID=UPI0036D2E9FE